MPFGRKIQFYTYVHQISIILFSKISQLSAGYYPFQEEQVNDASFTEPLTASIRIVCVESPLSFSKTFSTFCDQLPSLVTL